jgi:hypothetical protein
MKKNIPPIGVLCFLVLCGMLTVNLLAGDVDYFKKGSKPNLEKTLLVINYNHPYYDSIDFLKEIYSPIFPNIVFYGEKEDPRVNVFAHNVGWWGQGVLADAMTRWPNFEGYFCVQDDCFMNFWNFTRLDKNKIWLCDIANKLSLDTPQDFWWIAWNRDSGKPALLSAFNHLTPEQKERIAKSVGPGNTGFTYHDFVYVPGRLREGFIKQCAIFSDPKIFVELALPNILMSLEEVDKWERLNLSWGVSEAEYKTSFDWVHPIKFSKEQNRDFIKKIVTEWKANGNSN